MNLTHIFIYASTRPSLATQVNVAVYDETGNPVFQEQLVLKENADISRSGLVGVNTREDVIRQVTRKCDAIDLASSVPVFGVKTP